MFWLGLLLAVCFVPGYTGASIPTQWAVLYIVLPLSLWRQSSTTLLHKLFFIFILWALASILWVINLHAWVWGIWLALIWAMAFRLGTTLSDLRPLWKGLAVGLSFSSVVAITQALEFTPVETNDPYQYAGLLFNSSVQGIVIGLVLVALTIHRLWWYIPILAIGLILSGSRGGLLVLTLGLLAHYTNWLIVYLAVALGALGLSIGIDPADNQRLQIWSIALRAISFLGNGPGTFTEAFYIAPIRGIRTLIHPEFVHNDIIQLGYEYGLGSLALLAVFALALFKTSNPSWPIAFTFTALLTFYFPLYAPLSAFIGCIVAGHIARDWTLDGHLLHHRGFDLVPGRTYLEPRFDPTWGEALPLVERTTNSKA